MAKGKVKRKKLPFTKEQKQAKAILGVTVVLLIGLFIALIYGVFLIVNTEGETSVLKQIEKYEKVNYGEGKQLEPVKDVDGNWCFVADREIKILQFTDVHIGGGILSVKNDIWAMNAVAAMITAEKPDFVIVTGDIAYPVPFSSGSFDNLRATRIFSSLMEQLGVYWTFGYGNHDTEIYSYYTREDINDYYVNKNFKYCLYQRGNENIAGYGNNVYKVKNSEGIVTQALFVMDSHSYTDGDAFGVLWKYDNIHQDQIDWYAKTVDGINAANKSIKADVADVKSMAFFHIPLPEYRKAYQAYYENGQKDTQESKLIYGKMGETMKKNSLGQQTYGVFCGVGEDNMFETGKEKGLQAIFCGHDHYNNFSIDYNGIRLTYGLSVDYLAYPMIWQEKSQRGCTVITVKPDGSFDCVGSNYYQDKYKPLEPDKATK